MPDSNGSNIAQQDAASGLRRFNIHVARLGWLCGVIEIDADSVEAAYARARETAEADADWPIDCDGDPVQSGFGPIEISMASSETPHQHDWEDHDGDPAGPPNAVYLAAPEMLAALKAVAGCPQAAPWLARLPLAHGPESTWDAVLAAIAKAEAA